ncbi:cellulose synthase subunit BcsC-related outer membrane protein, partial [Escherichia coli]|uniref:cellulose synthase subunit BcsC-related outer membrane protein n=1 Tax=Escherichia coli TaxID=562 RepID=UPI00208E30D3
GGTADRNRSHWSTSKTPSYTKSVSWQHHQRRVTSNWFVGTAIDIQQAKDYAPSHFLLYVRYSAAGWQGDMDLPPQPLIPYADW